MVENTEEVAGFWPVSEVKQFIFRGVRFLIGEDMQPGKVVEFIHSGGAVKRYHTENTVHTQTVAAHSFGVAMLAYLMSCQRVSQGEPTRPINVVMAALAHDLAEQVTGDIPAPTKRQLNIGESLGNIEKNILSGRDLNFETTPEEQRILKLADYMEGMIFCCREKELGNKKIVEVFENFDKYVEELGPFSRVEQDIITSIHDRWWNNERK